VELAEQNPKIIGITAAMPTGTSMKYLLEKIPERAFDVGIAEQHAVTMAAGLAAEGFIPFCAIYSTFLQRAYDQIIHDVALQNLPVVFCLDRSGLVGEDGPTHHGVFDMAYLRIIPNLIVAAPMDEIELRDMMYTAQLGLQHPIAIRYPRGRGFNRHWHQDFKAVEIGKGRILREGNKIAVLSIGTIGQTVKNAIEALHSDAIAHYDMRFVKPLDTILMHEIAQKFSTVVTVEDGTLKGGFGSEVLEFLEEHNYLEIQLSRLGLPDRFIPHGSSEELYRSVELDQESLMKKLKTLSE
jgi:1-deoxy-D-xylulose-5-phosphate synthase